MKRIILLFFIFNATILQGICSDDIYFNFDYAVFKGEEGKSILEIYYSVNQNSLKYIKKENSFEAGALIDIQIKDMGTNNVVYSNIYKSPSVVSDTSKETNNQKLIGQVNYLLNSGKYLLSIYGIDFNDTNKKDILEKEISVENYDQGNIQMSDIELSSSIRKVEKSGSPFYKNTLEIIPNPSGLFGMNLNELYYYLEIYGLTVENISDQYILNYEIRDLNNESVLSFNKTFDRKMEAKADYGKIIIDSLNRGSYSFIVSTIDSVKNINIKSEKKFYIFNTSGTVATNSGQNDFLKSEYSSMPEAQLEAEYEKMTYIINTQAEKRFESLKELDDKRKFMYEFWKSQDVNPETQVLETKNAYMKRVAEANKNYAEPYTEGWTTDRGRIYIIYGKPDDVERYPFETQSKSYEIWKYNTIEGGGECVFIEFQTSSGVYRLVHSTFRNELKNQEYETLLENPY